MVLDPEAFGGREQFNRKTEAFLDYVRSSRLRDPEVPIRLPGERGYAALDDCRQNGIPLDEEKLEMLSAIAESNSMPLPRWLEQ